MVFLVGALLAAPTACAQDEWWGADIAEAPCDLGMTPAVEREAEATVLSTEVIDTGYEIVCAYELGGGASVRMDVFPSRPDIVDALTGGVVWTPGSTDRVAHQGLHRPGDASDTIYTRAVVADVAANVSLTREGTDAELIASGEALAFGAARAVVARR